MVYVKACLFAPFAALIVLIAALPYILAMAILPGLIAGIELSEDVRQSLREILNALPRRRTRSAEPVDIADPMGFFGSVSTVLLGCILVYRIDRVTLYAARVPRAGGVLRLLVPNSSWLKIKTYVWTPVLVFAGAIAAVAADRFEGTDGSIWSTTLREMSEVEGGAVFGASVAVSFPFLFFLSPLFIFDGTRSAARVSGLALEPGAIKRAPFALLMVAPFAFFASLVATFILPIVAAAWTNGLVDPAEMPALSMPALTIVYFYTVYACAAAILMRKSLADLKRQHDAAKAAEGLAGGPPQSHAELFAARFPPQGEPSGARF